MAGSDNGGIVTIQRCMLWIPDISEEDPGVGAAPPPDPPKKKTEGKKCLALEQKCTFTVEKSPPPDGVKPSADQILDPP